MNSKLSKNILIIALSLAVFILLALLLIGRDISGDYIGEQDQGEFVASKEGSVTVYTGGCYVCRITLFKDGACVTNYAWGKDRDEAYKKLNSSSGHSTTYSYDKDAHLLRIGSEILKVSKNYSKIEWDGVVLKKQ